jgi:hypothetical protein
VFTCVNASARPDPKECDMAQSNDKAPGSGGTNADAALRHAAAGAATMRPPVVSGPAGAGERIRPAGPTETRGAPTINPLVSPGTPTAPATPTVSPAPTQAPAAAPKKGA